MLQLPACRVLGLSSQNNFSSLSFQLTLHFAGSNSWINRQIHRIYPNKLSNVRYQHTEMTQDCDFAVIGGGSGGIAAAKEAARLGARTVLFDYVAPSPRGTLWGLGGTCVNVGCIPKKLMHYASLISPILKHDANELGWNVTAREAVDWEKLVETVQMTVKKLSFMYRSSLKQHGVTYINAEATLKDANTVEYKQAGETKSLRSKYVLLGGGGRPYVPPDMAGREHVITSDDLFSLSKAPNKTLVVGGSYIALECAGFLSKLGFDVSVAIRSAPLRLFDRQCGEKVAGLMEEMGTKILRPALVTKLEKINDETLQATFNTGAVESYNTVLVATGRKANIIPGYEKLGIQLSQEGKILCTADRMTSVPGIFAVGDIVHGLPELTPVAIRDGQYLARRLFGDSNELLNMDIIPTTVFTPIEYSCIGLSEEDAIANYGADDIEVYLQAFTTLELSALHRQKAKPSDENDTDMSSNCLSKLICLKSKKEKVVGFHFVGPNAGEIAQGFAVAMRLGATKEDFDKCVGIHPTDAESFTGLTVTRASGESYDFSACGGGRCG